MARGVEVESWVAYTEFQQLRSGGNVTDTLQEVFFTRPDWKIGSHSSAESSDPTLWRSRFSGTFSFFNTTTDRIETHKFRVTYDFFAFDRGVHDRDIFDTSVCVLSGDYYIVTLFLPVEEIDVDFSLLPRNVRAAIAGFTKIEPLQVGNIQVGSRFCGYVCLKYRVLLLQLRFCFISCVYTVTPTTEWDLSVFSCGLSGPFKTCTTYSLYSVENCRCT